MYPLPWSRGSNHFDDLLKSGLSVVINCDLSDLRWLQACLPVRDGGLGIRRAAPLARSAFLASAAGSLNLQDEILANAALSDDAHVAEFEAMWGRSLKSLQCRDLPHIASNSATWVCTPHDCPCGKTADARGRLPMPYPVAWPSEGWLATTRSTI